MRKFYSLLAVLLFVLVSSPANAKTVEDSCRADFERVSSTTINLLTAGFRALPWINNDKKPEQICWNFGDNHDTCINYDPTLSNNYYVAHTYANAGVYNVCVRIKYQGGCVAEKCKLQTVGEPDNCTADFEAGLISSTLLGRHFTAIPWNNHNKKPVFICWKFGDNHDTCIQYSNTFTGPYSVNHIYKERGQYEVCARIVYDGGCEAKKCKIIQIGEVSDSCRADFERIPASSTNPSLVYYRALPWNNHEKKPARICWSFGDGKDTCISYSENYTGSYVAGHHYDRSGIYEVCVKINYYGGCEARKCKLINIFLYNIDCRVHLYEIVPSVTSLQRGFYFVSSNDIRPTRICWNFGDGTDTCITVEPNATEIPHAIKHTYPAPGAYRACVKVLFANGCTASDCHEVSIRSFTDMCGGYYTDSLIDSHTYLFKGFSIHKPDDKVVGYRWTFGDGSSGVGEKITHAYNVAGVYRVCLFINTEKGCETKICNDVRVAGTTQSTLQLTPNPVINVLHALFYSTHNESVKIKIINSNGVVVREYTRTAVVGANGWEFDLSGLVSGVYSFVVQSPNQFAAGIFFKQ
ncbi:MAG TPA: PKD domain-containing protein [Chitinophagaceae bacterium]|jgi:PKD repeat protein|nr:PKD domain-containing protein [Chitinophagaceae bacterium]